MKRRLITSLFLIAFILSSHIYAQNGADGTTPIHKLQVEGTAYIRDSLGIGNATPIASFDANGTALFRGVNRNIFPFTMAGGVEFFLGRNAAGTLPDGLIKADLSFNWGGPNGGYRHFISSRHDVTMESTGNAIDFYINNSDRQNGSASPRYGNRLQLSVTGNGIGIGTGDPAAKLHVAGNQKIDGANTLEFGAGVVKAYNAGKIGYGFLSDGALDITGAGSEVTRRKIKFWNEGGASFSGKVAIGRDTATEKLDVDGNIKLTGRIIKTDSVLGVQFKNFGWSNQGGHSGPAVFYKDKFGVVHLEGTITNGGIPGTYAAAFTLPEGYRPNAFVYFVCNNDGDIGYVRIDSFGTVYIKVTRQAWVSLSGIYFRTGN